MRRIFIISFGVVTTVASLATITLAESIPVADSWPKLPVEPVAYAADETPPPPPNESTLETQKLPEVSAAATSAPAQPPAPPPPQPWSMPQPCFLQAIGGKMGGWIDQGITFNNHHPDNHFNGPVGLNDLDSEYQMNQLWLYFDRPMKNNGEGWGIGGHVDLVYGTDWRFGINHGLEDRINGFEGQTYGLVLPQFYADVGYNDLTVRVGHFASPLLVYETIPAVANPFYSHSYATAFSEPLLMTGVLAEYKLTDQLTPFVGFNRGWNMFEDYNESLDVMGGARWESANKRSKLVYAFDCGPQDPDGVQQRFSHVFLYRQQLGKRSEYIFQHDSGAQQNTPAQGQTATWYDICQYYFYQINPKWRAGGRFEWFRDNNGARVFGPPPEAGIRAWPGAPGFVGDFWEFTMGVTWRPNLNIMVRPECRWDWYDGSRNVQGQLPFNDGMNSSQFLFATDVIFTF